MTKEELETIAKMPRAQRMAKIAQLRAEGKMSDYDYYQVYRPMVEAQRGIKRDENGKIIRTKSWLKERVELLKSKEADLKNRLSNVQKEIKSRQKELKSK